MNQPSSSPTGLHVVLGAGGGTGGALVQELRSRGLPVRAVTRSGSRAGLPAGVDVVAADASSATSLAPALAGAAVVYHAVNVPYQRWLAELPGMTSAIIEATAAAGAKLVFADNLYAYGPTDGPMTESTPMAATDRKGRLRAQLATDLLAAHASGRLRVTIGQSPDYFGPGGRNSAVGSQVFERVAAGQAPRWLGSADVPHSVIYLPDLASGLVTLALSDAADGRAWHLPVTGSPTGRELVAAVERHLGRPVKLSVMGATPIRLLGIVSSMLREIGPLMYEWERPFVSDASAFAAAFGPVRTTPLEEAVATTVDWFAAEARRAAA